MTVDSTRTLLSFDALDDDEHDLLDEWGNRAVLTEPGPTRFRFRSSSPRR